MGTDNENEFLDTFIAIWDMKILCQGNIIVKMFSFFMYFYYTVQKHQFLMDWKLKHVSQPTKTGPPHTHVEKHNPR